MNVLLRQDSRLADSGNNGLNPEATSRRDKRRSINPGLVMPTFKDISAGQGSPRNGTFTSGDPRGTPTPPYLTANDHQQFPPTTSRPSSRAGSVHSTRSTTLNVDREPPRSRSRSSSINANPYDNDHDDTIVMTSPPSMHVDLDAATGPSQYVNARNSGFSQKSATLSPTDANGFNWGRRGSNASSYHQRSGTPSRSASPAYRADVPHSIESGTDTENEDQPSDLDIAPPALPPKDTYSSGRNPAFRVSDSSTAESSEAAHGGDVSNEDFGQAVEQTSHTTFIAPALPPIRFSMNTADFSELLSSVGGLPSLKSLDKLAKSTKQAQDNIPSTPPTSAATVLSPGSRNGAISPADDSESQSNPIMTITPSDDSRDNEATDQSTTMLLPSSVLPDTNTLSNSRKAGDIVIGKLREAVNSAKDRGIGQLSVDLDFAGAIIDLLESRNTEFSKLKHKVDGMNVSNFHRMLFSTTNLLTALQRQSQRYIDGLSVAQVEYDQELKARRDAEAEVTRLRVLLSGQAARLTALSGDNRRQEVRQQLSKEMNENLSGLEQDLSRLKVERDVTLAEVEELSTKT